MSNSSPIQISFTNRFEKDARRLAKRYRNIRLDIQSLIQRLEAGELPGDKIPNLGQTVFKVRVKNSVLKRAKAPKRQRQPLAKLQSTTLKKAFGQKLPLHTSIK